MSRISLSLLLLAAMASPAWAQGRPDAPVPAPLPPPATRFTSTVTASIAGRTQRLDIILQTFLIGNLTSVELPHTGDLIVHVRAGDLAAVVDGQRGKHTPDESFVVLAGARVMIETDRDSAVVQVVEVSPSR